MPLHEHASTRILDQWTVEDVRDLIVPFAHTSLIQRHRALLIISRVRWVAAVFAILTPLWIVIDMAFFPWPLWGWLALLRVVSSAGFAFLASSQGINEEVSGARLALAGLLSIPTLFFIISHPLLNQYEVGGPAAAIAAGYAFLPFVMVAGLSVFPLTAIEGMLFAAPLLVAHLGAGLLGSMVLPFNSYIGALWLLALLTVVAALSAMSQLHFMTALVNQTAHDVLTGAFARRVGEELLRLQFSNGRRANLPLSVMFIDIDNFKSINDRYGHEEGDRALREAALALSRHMRHSDMIVRWGGEEFVLILPNTDSAGAETVIRRLREEGLGLRPDGSPLTASIGVAESHRDAASDGQALVELADQRMYQAKQNGKNRACIADGVFVV